MLFNKHIDLRNAHAFLGASNYHWINYDDEKFDLAFAKRLAVIRGTQMHELAHMCIKLRRKQPETNDTFNMYVNDAISFRMRTEQILFYSLNSFGTADAICFRDGVLRIHDLKTGESPVSMQQLAVYAALFGLEYDVDPRTIGIEFRIYQKNSVVVDTPPGAEIYRIMNLIVARDKRIEELKKEEQWEIE